MHHAPVVVFVDTRNLCRSPAAAAVFASHAAAVGLAVHVRSAGTHAVHGAPATRAIQRAAGRGLGALAVHRSAPFAGDMVTSADLVVAMGPEELRAVVGEHPEVTARAFTWRGLIDLSARVAPKGDGLGGWVARLHERRTAVTGGVLPVGHELAVAPARGWTGHRRLLAQLDTMAARTAALLAAAAIPLREATAGDPVRMALQSV